MFVKMKMMRSPVLSRVPAPVSLRSVCARVCMEGSHLLNTCVSLLCHVLVWFH